MRIIWKSWPFFLILAALLAYVLLRPSETVRGQVAPEVLDIRASQAMVVWLSETDYRGRVFYWSSGNEQSPMTATEMFASRQHEVVLTGLRPSTRYTYQIEGSENRYQLQTQPSATLPFSFLVVWGDIADRIASLVSLEFCEFIVSLSPDSGFDGDVFADVRPYVPVYNLAGMDSPFMATVEGTRPKESKSLWTLDWGGFRLVVASTTTDAAEIGTSLDTPAAHTLGILIAPEAGKELEAGKIDQTAFHAVLKTHNEQYPARPAAFVAMSGRAFEPVEIDGIRYFGIDHLSDTQADRQKTDYSGAIRIDIDVDSARAVYLDEDEEIVLKEPPLAQKLTCEDCRRLADQGAYEASIAAYKEFIEANEGHFQIDDAYYAIADIYDFRLFEFEKAMTWYRRLVDAYPQGTLVPLARQRIRHISAYADYNYEPLSRFERIRTVDFARRKGQPDERDKILDEVESLIQEFPDSRLAPVMQLWMANQLRSIDADRAVRAYLTLKNTYSGHDEAKEAMFEIGATYYDAERYREAVDAFREALVELPDLAATIGSQIDRAERNIRRDKIARICWVLMAGFGILTVLFKPRRVDGCGVVRGCVVFVLTAGVLYAGAWLIREQFNSAKEMHLVVTSFAALSGLGVFVAMNVTQKLVRNGSYVMALSCGTAASLLFLLTGFYLILYHFHVHYLIILRL